MLIYDRYAARQVQTRMSLFYCASALSGAFSGLLAAGIAKMDGVSDSLSICTSKSLIESINRLVDVSLPRSVIESWH